MAKKSRAGFTILELLTVVAMLLILASLALPAYTGYVRRSKASEVASNLNSLFKSASTYYSQERAGTGFQSSAMAGHCTVGGAGPLPFVPGAQKQKFDARLAGGENFRALGFTISDLVYYSYGMAASSASCGKPKNSPALYTFYANGDLDEDGELSTFELVAGSDQDNLLYHGVGFYVAAESE